MSPINEIRFHRPQCRGAYPSERGSIALTAALMLVLVMGMVLSAMVIGRQVFNRRELQTAADSMVLAAAHGYQQYGEIYNPLNKLHFLTDNTRLKILNATFVPVVRPAAELRWMVRLDVSALFDSEQTWFPNRFSTIKLTSYAQFNEQWFGDTWPIIIIILDSSESMKYPILGSAGVSAFNVLSDTITEYASNTLPVRNGLIIFNTTVTLPDVAPKTYSENNLAAITTALKGAKPQGRTATRDALDRATTRLAPLTDKGKNVIMITDGEPTAGTGCTTNSPTCFTLAQTAASALRNSAKAALFTVEIRRTNYFTGATTFLTQISGKPSTSGNDGSMHYLVQSKLGIQTFMTALTRSICAWGPIRPDPGSAADAYRVRSPMDNPDQDPRRVYVYLHDTTSGEINVPMVSNRDLYPASHAFEYYSDATGDWVILSLHSCNYLGGDANRRLVVRWDQPQLAAAP